MKPLILFTLLCVFLLACSNATKTASSETPPPPPLPEHSLPKEKDAGPIIKGKLVIAIDTLLSHKNNGFKCDSAIILKYKIIRGRDAYMPLTEDGHWIPNVIKRKKLTAKQLHFVNSMFGAKKTFNELMMACFEPQIGFVYFKDGKVIAQSCLCLTCSAIQSTAKLGNGKDFGDMNGDASDKLDAFYKSLKM